MNKHKKCLSTHGLAGYAPGSYWDGNVIVCGYCGQRISNPPPTGRKFIEDKGWRGKLFGHGRWVNTYGDAVSGHETI